MGDLALYTYRLPVVCPSCVDKRKPVPAQFDLAIDVSNPAMTDMRVCQTCHVLLHMKSNAEKIVLWYQDNAATRFSEYYLNFIKPPKGVDVEGEASWEV
jgi:hypothetical protein